jgi:hypothetical protein
MSFGTVVNLRPSNIIDVWTDYCSRRGITEDMLATLPSAALLPMGDTLLKRIPNAYRWKQDGCIGAFVYELEPGEWRGRALYGDLDVPKPGDTKAVKGPKYIGPTGHISLLFMSTMFNDWFTAKEPYNLLIVEGVLNALRLNAEGIRAVGIPGVYNFRIGNKNTPMITNLHRLLQSECVNKVTVMFDSDTRTPEDNPPLWNATNGFLLEILKVRKGKEQTVFQCSPPARVDGSKNGPDDYLNEKGIIEFQRLLDNESTIFADHPWLLLERKVTGQFIYDTMANVMWNIDRRIPMKKDHANTVMMSMGQALDIRAAKPKLTPFAWDDYMTSPLARLADGVMFNPATEDVYFVDTKAVPPVYRINTFNPSDVPDAIQGDMSLFMWALGNICRDTPTAVQKVLTVAAYHAQNPTLTPKYAFLFVGDKGAGKSNMAKCIGLALSKRFHNSRVDSSSPYNGEWRGFPAKEWPEYDAKMDPEDMKSLVTDEQYLHNPKYGVQHMEYNHTLNIFTSNTFQSRIQEGDRRFLICGNARADDKIKGLEFEAWCNGQGPNILRYFLLNYDCSNYHILDVTTEISSKVIDASKSYKRTLADDVREILMDYEGLDLVPNSILEIMIAPHRTSLISFNKENGHIFTAPAIERVKIAGQTTAVRLRCFRNYDVWSKETDTNKYREQYELAQKFFAAWQKGNRSKY